MTAMAGVPTMDELLDKLEEGEVYTRQQLRRHGWNSYRLRTAVAAEKLTRIMSAHYGKGKVPVPTTPTDGPVHYLGWARGFTECGIDIRIGLNGIPRKSRLTGKLLKEYVCPVRMGRFKEVTCPTCLEPGIARAATRVQSRERELNAARAELEETLAQYQCAVTSSE